MLSRLFSKRTARALGVSVPRGLVFDADTLELVAELPAGGWRGDLVADGSGVWATTHDDRSLCHLDPDCEVRLRVDLPGKPVQVAHDGHAPVVLCDGGRVVRVDPLSGAITADVSLADGTTAIAAGEGRIWVLVSHGMTSDGFELALAQLDPATLQPMHELELGRSRFFGDVRIHAGTVNVLREIENAMHYATFDAVTGEPRPTDPELEQVRGIAERDGVRWTRKDESLRKVDLATGTELAERDLEVPAAGSFLFAHDRIWAVAWRPPSRGHHDV